MGGKLQQSLHDVNLIHHLLHRNDPGIGACAENRRSPSCGAQNRSWTTEQKV
jgi:hypothetical protein